MKTEQQRIAIAEACGWTPHPDNDKMEVKCWTLGGSKYGERGSICARSAYINDATWGLEQRALPDYLNDLNAMHEAEKVLTDDQELRYFQVLMCSDVIHLNGLEYVERQMLHYAINATAAQRSRAFLKTLNLWRD